MVPNTDQKSQDYSEMSVAYRPSHADATYDMKYGIRAVRAYPVMYLTSNSKVKQHDACSWFLWHLLPEVMQLIVDETCCS